MIGYNNLALLGIVVVATTISIYAICKQFKYITSLRSEIALDVNKYAFVFHAVLMVMQVSVFVLELSLSIYVSANGFTDTIRTTFNLCVNIQVIVDFCI